MPHSELSYAENIRLNYDPEKAVAAPPGGFASVAEEAQAAEAAGLPQPVPCPRGSNQRRSRSIMPRLKGTASNLLPATMRW